MLFAAAVALCTAAPAGEPVVAWDAPSSCPSEPQVRSWAVELLRATGPDAVPVDARGTVRVTSEGGFELELSIDSPRGRQARVMHDDRCETLARAAAVVIAVAADAVAVVEAITPEDSDDPGGVPMAPARASTVDDSPVAPEPEPDLAPVPRPVGAASSPAAPAAPAARWRAGLRAQGSAGWGILPRGDFGFGVAAAAIHPLARIELVLHHVVRSPARYADHPAAGADLRTFTAQARGCGVPSHRTLEFPLCAGIEAGAVTGRGVGVSVSRSAVAPWAAAVAGAALAWRAAPSVAIWMRQGPRGTGPRRSARFFARPSRAPARNQCGEVLAAPDLCGRSLCEEICRLHPCDSPEGDCVAACEAAAADLDEEQLRAITLAAAATPVLCTCDVCSSDSFDFCATVWGCQSG